MAFEYLDLENKLYIPTQQLMEKVQLDLLSFYAYLRQNLASFHGFIAEQGRAFYDRPGETLTLWYKQSVTYANELYAVVVDKLVPQAEATYQEVVASASELAMKTRDTFNYVTENPEKVTAETIESMTETITAAGNVSAEMVDALQSKTAEIVALLMEQPIKTLEAAYHDLLTGVLNGYFELVSSILVTI